MRLEEASLHPPSGLSDFLTDLGTGENGFGGTPVATGELTVAEFLQRCLEMKAGKNIPPGYVPQTIFWVVDEEGKVIGMARVRHYLNDPLRERGGHIGYYIRRDRRGRGYAKEALRQALAEVRKFGETRALLTVNMDNLASIRVIQANGGVLESEGLGDQGQRFGRFWIDLSEQP